MVMHRYGSLLGVETGYIGGHGSDLPVAAARVGDGGLGREGVVVGLGDTWQSITRGHWDVVLMLTPDGVSVPERPVGGRDACLRVRKHADDNGRAPTALSPVLQFRIGRSKRGRGSRSTAGPDASCLSALRVWAKKASPTPRHGNGGLGGTDRGRRRMLGSGNVPSACAACGHFSNAAMSERPDGPCETWRIIETTRTPDVRGGAMWLSANSTHRWAHSSLKGTSED